MKMKYLPLKAKRGKKFSAGSPHTPPAGGKPFSCAQARCLVTQWFSWLSVRYLSCRNMLSFGYEFTK